MSPPPLASGAKQKFKLMATIRKGGGAMKKLAPREKKLIAAAAVAIVVFLLIQFAVSPLLGY